MGAFSGMAGLTAAGAEPNIGAIMPRTGEIIE